MRANTSIRLFASLPVSCAGGAEILGLPVTGLSSLSDMDGLLLRIGALLRHWITALSAARRLQGHAGGVEHGIAAQHWSVRAAKGSINKDRTSVVEGKSVSVRVDLGGSRSIQTTRPNNMQ